MKHYKSVKTLSNFQKVKSPCVNLNPLFKNFWRRYRFLNLTHPFTRQFGCVRFLAVWKSKKHANRERNSYKCLGAFYVTCFARVCEIFYIRGKRVATWPTRCALKCLCRHNGRQKGWQEGAFVPPWILKIAAKKVVFCNFEE